MEAKVYRVTRLEVQKKNHQRVNVYLDGEFAFGLSRIVAAWLQVGQDIGEEKIQELKAQDAREVAFQRAIRYLDYQPRSITEVRRKLAEKEFPEDVIDLVLERLRDLQLLDDDRYARSWVENRSEFRPRGRRLLEYELRQRGIDRETIEQALTDLDEQALAYQAAVKQSRKLAGADWQSFQKKLFAFLARRGFDYETIQPVVQQVWSEQINRIPEDKSMAEEEDYQ
jgi:regulatory protein